MKADRPTTDGAERTDARPDRPGRGEMPLPDNREQGPQQTYDELAQAVQEDREKNPRRVLARPSEGADGDEGQSQPVDKWSDPETTSKRIDELKSEGHGPQRHLEVSDLNLQDRLGTAAHDANGNFLRRADQHVRKVPGSQIDPMTGTSTDFETGKPHFCGTYSTRFDDASDYARADEFLRARAAESGEPRQQAAITDIFPDGDANRRFTGYFQDPVRPENPDGSPRFREVDFTGGTILARYVRGDDGTFSLRTLFPEPDPSRNA